jgi:hypothetical protein
MTSKITLSTLYIVFVTVVIFVNISLGLECKFTTTVTTPTTRGLGKASLKVKAQMEFLTTRLRIPCLDNFPSACRTPKSVQ